MNGTCEWNAEKNADPPRSNDAPAEAEQRWVLGAEDRRMSNCEVLNANTRGDLIVDDTVRDARHNGEQNNRKPVHELYY